MTPRKCKCGGVAWEDCYPMPNETETVFGTDFQCSQCKVHTGQYESRDDALKVWHEKYAAPEAQP